jgi:hypothetical protein
MSPADPTAAQTAGLDAGHVWHLTTATTASAMDPFCGLKAVPFLALLLSVLPPNAARAAGPATPGTEPFAATRIVPELPARDVRQAVTRSFSVRDHAEVFTLLAGYRVNERERVQLAMLALAFGDAVELRAMVEAAQMDYRDVLLWAEYAPETARPSKRDMAQRYRALGADVPSTLREQHRPKKSP